MTLQDLIVPGYMTVLIGIVGWLLKADTGDIKKRMDCFESSQHACQLDNAKTFVTKADFKGLEKCVIDHDRRLVVLETRSEDDGK